MPTAGADSDGARDALLRLVEARRGHFRFESGYHGEQWLELDSLFVREAAVHRFTDALAALLAPFDVDAVCGPLVGGAFVAQRVAAALGVESYHAAPAPARPGGDAGALFAAAYQLPRVLGERVRGRRVALVDDVVSAGSSVRATATAVRACEGVTVAVGALLVMGDRAAAYFNPLGVPVLGVARSEITMWAPAVCPLCAAGVPLETFAAGNATP